MKNILKNKLFLTLAGILVVGIGVWAIAGNDNGSSGTSTSVNKEVQDKCMSDVNDSTFCKFAGAFGAASSYKVSANIATEGGTTTLEMASDSKDNSQMVIKLNGQEQGNVVLYNGVTYSKDYTDGKWFMYGANDATKPEITDLKKEFAKGDFKADNGQKIDYINLGKEACGSLTCYKYQIKDPTKADQEGFLFFDTKDYLMRKLSIKDASSSTTMDVTYSSVSISAPSPTKDITGN